MRATLRILTLAAVTTFASAASAAADCCNTHGPEVGTLVGAGDHAFLPYAHVEAETDGPEEFFGAVASISSAGLVTRPALPLGASEQRDLPGVAATADGGVDALWRMAAGELRLAHAPFGGPFAVHTVAAPAATKGPVAIVTGPDGARIAAAMVDGGLGVRRIAADGAAGPLRVLAGADTREWRLVGDSTGNAALVFRDPAGLRALLLPSAADLATVVPIDLAPAAELYPTGVVVSDAAADGGGGLRVLVFARRGTRGKLVLTQLAAGGLIDRTTLSNGTKRVYPHGRLSTGGVAYVAEGKAGRGDVYARRLTLGQAPGQARAITRTKAGEAGVSGIALGDGERRYVTYERPTGKRQRLDLFVRSVAFASGSRSKERNLSDTPRDDDYATGLVALDGGRLAVAFISSVDNSDDTYSYYCDALRVRVLTATTATATKTVDACTTSSVT